jgi:hypothetical protein
MFTKARLPASLLFLLAVACRGATYRRHTIDGSPYQGFARSLETSKYYPVNVIFDGIHARVRLETGTTFVFKLDSENIQDPEEILAADRSGLWWTLSLDGIESQGNRTKNVRLKRIVSPTAQTHHSNSMNS